MAARACHIARDATGTTTCQRFWEQVTGIDDHSRFCVIATVVLRATARTVCSAFVTAMAEYKDLMARMGHESERAAIIYQHEARGADAAITSAIDAHVEAERGRDDEDNDGTAGAPGSGGLMAR